MALISRKYSGNIYICIWHAFHPKLLAFNSRTEFFHQDQDQDHVIPATVCGCGANLCIWSSIVPQVSSLLNDRFILSVVILWHADDETQQLILKKEQKSSKKCR